MLKTVRCSPALTGMDKSFGNSIPKTSWMPEAPLLYNTFELPSSSPVPPLMDQHLHSSAVWATRDNQPQAGLWNELWFLFFLFGDTCVSPHTSPVLWGWHLPCSTAPEKAGFNNAGGLGRIPGFHWCPLFHELFNENEFSPGLLKSQVCLFFLNITIHFTYRQL